MLSSTFECGRVKLSCYLAPAHPTLSAQLSPPGGEQEQRRCVDGTLQREVKKVRKARNRRQEWNMMALDKELRPDHRHTIHRDRGTSSEGSMSPENRSVHPRPHKDAQTLFMKVSFWQCSTREMTQTQEVQFIRKSLLKMTMQKSMIYPRFMDYPIRTKLNSKIIFQNETGCGALSVYPPLSTALLRPNPISTPSPLPLTPSPYFFPLPLQNKGEG